MSDNQAENDSESSLPTFRPFTREEYAIIDNRIIEKRAAAIKRAERRARNIAVRHHFSNFKQRFLSYCVFDHNIFYYYEYILSYNNICVTYFVRHLRTSFMRQYPIIGFAYIHAMFLFVFSRECYNML